MWAQPVENKGFKGLLEGLRGGLRARGQGGLTGGLDGRLEADDAQDARAH